MWMSSTGPGVTRAAGFDQERQGVLPWAAVGFCILVGLFLAFSDPAWRLLYSGALVSPIRPGSTAAWKELDHLLMERLTSVEIEAVAGNVDLEEAVVTALNHLRAEPGSTVRSPIEISEDLRAIARARARTRLALPLTVRAEVPELLHPETYLGLVTRKRLIHSVEVHQRLSSSVSPTSLEVIEELVDGWLSHTTFRNAVMVGKDLRIGVGAVSSEDGETLLEVLLEETLALLDQELPAVASADVPLTLSGRRLGEERLTLYLEGPSDPSYPLKEVEWRGSGFQLQLDWSQGAGVYALRAHRGERLSDPRPILVKLRHGS